MASTVTLKVKSANGDMMTFTKENNKGFEHPKKPEDKLIFFENNGVFLAGALYKDGDVLKCHSFFNHDLGYSYADVSNVHYAKHIEVQDDLIKMQEQNNWSNILRLCSSTNDELKEKLNKFVKDVTHDDLGFIQDDTRVSKPPVRLHSTPEGPQWAHRKSASIPPPVQIKKNKPIKAIPSTPSTTDEKKTTKKTNKTMKKALRMLCILHKKQILSNDEYINKVHKSLEHFTEEEYIVFINGAISQM